MKMKSNIKLVVLVMMDALAIVITAYGALALRFDFNFNAQFLLYSAILQKVLPIVLFISIGSIYAAGLYKSLWRYASIKELISVVLAAFWSSIIIYTSLQLLNFPLPRSFFLLFPLLFMTSIGGMRFAYSTLKRFKVDSRQIKGRELQQKRLQDLNCMAQRVLIIGAGKAGYLVVKELKTNLSELKVVVGILDDDRHKIGRTIEGVKVLGVTNDVALWVAKLKVDEIIFAIPSLQFSRRKELLNQCKALHVRLRILPGIFQIIDGQVDIKRIRDVAIEDLLGRDTVRFDDSDVLNLLNGQVVLITGAGGSIGSELSRQVAQYKPKQLILFDIYENSIYDIQIELHKKHANDVDIVVLIGSVREPLRLKEVFQTFRPDCVFHAAAHKHVPLMQGSPFEAIANNSFGTYNVAKAAGESGAKRMVLISTDKAVNPTNIMGASKRLAEFALLNAQKCYSQTEYMAVRFGNVLGSNGSVVPIFKKQIESGEAITVTHPDIIRYFMTIPEAVQLVLQSGALARGGEIFILDMGEPVRIVKLAEDLIRLSGYEPYIDIDIVFTGLRPGEKLFEELLLAEEGIHKTSNERIYIGKAQNLDFDFINQVFMNIETAMTERNIDSLELNILKLIPTYRVIERVN